MCTLQTVAITPAESNGSTISTISGLLDDIAQEWCVVLRDLEKIFDSGKLQLMPELSRFLGISIIMYFNDHPPPHFQITNWNRLRDSGEFRKKDPLV